MRRGRLKALTWPALAMPVVLSGCAVGPDYRPLDAAALKVPDRFVAAPERVAMPVVDPIRWWNGFDDPVLSGFVEQAFAANLDVAVAGARLRQARAAVRQAIGAGLPQLGVSGSVNRSVGRDGQSFIDPTTGNAFNSGGDTTIYRAGFDASWEADIFGGIRRSVEAARADAASSEASLHDVQLSIAAEVALNYIQARLAQARLGIARANLASQDETVQIVGWRVQAGLVSSLDLEQARQLRATTAATIPTLETSYVAAANRIAVLLAETPGAVTATLDPGAPVPLAPAAAAIPRRDGAAPAGYRRGRTQLGRRDRADRRGEGAALPRAPAFRQLRRIGHVAWRAAGGGAR